MLKLVPYGAPARDALGGLIAALKAVEPLAPVTVIVPSNYAGLATRRALVSAGGLANVRFQGAARLAELLGAPQLIAAGKRPLTDWVRIQAVRAALKRMPGVFAGVAEHPATARELQRVFGELREVSDSGLAALSAIGPRPADVVALYRDYRSLTSRYFDDVDLLDAAADVIEQGGAGAAEAGPLVLYLPRRLPASLARLLTAAARSIGAHAILGLTGDTEVDAVAQAMAAQLTALGPVERAGAVLPSAGRVISTTDPEEEVREAIRQAMRLAGEGVPLHRIALTYASREVYAGLLDDALTSAGVPHNTAAMRTLASTLAGRTVLGLLRLSAAGRSGDAEFRRDAVMDWLTSAPIRDSATDREAPSHRWDEISRSAGIVRGVAQWLARLDRYAAAQELEADDRFEDKGSALRRNAQHARDLRNFIESLHREVGPDRAATHARHAEAALGWLRMYLPAHLLGDDEEQLDARERVERILKEITELSAELPPAMDPMVGRGEFASALEQALDVPFGRHGKLGEGVFCGAVSAAGEMDFDVIIVLGMVEGAFPAGQRDDPLLTAEERARTGDELAPAARLPTESRRAYLAALHSATTMHMLSAPRADLRRQRTTQPSRWLLDSASQLNGGERLYTSDLEKLLASPPGWFHVVHSFEAALRDGSEPGSIQEWDLGSLLRYRGRFDRHFLLMAGGPNPLRRGREAREARAPRRGRASGGTGHLSEWNGKVPAGSVPAPGVARPIAPTSLETFAKCPFRYFLAKVIRVGEVEFPEEVVTIEPATVGSMVHKILEDFFTEMQHRPDPRADWTEAERATLERFTKASFDDAERRGLTGKALTWQAEQRRIRRDLDLLLDRELLERRQTGNRLKGAEVAFGVEPRVSQPDPLPAATFTLASGETVSFRGKIDRVDEAPDGRVLITDYKTGSIRSYESLSSKNPLNGGQFLQLPVYALAFREAEGPPVSARYWFISEGADFESKTVELDDNLYQKFGETVETLVETLRNGYFPAVPGDDDFRPGSGDSNENCRYCPYDSLCPSSSRLEMWRTAKEDPGLAAFAALNEDPATGDGR